MSTRIVEQCSHGKRKSVCELFNGQLFRRDVCDMFIPVFLHYQAVCWQTLVTMIIILSTDLNPSIQVSFPTLYRSVILKGSLLTILQSLATLYCWTDSYHYIFSHRKHYMLLFNNHVLSSDIHCKSLNLLSCRVQPTTSRMKIRISSVSDSFGRIQFPDQSRLICKDLLIVFV